jgi:transcriptional regulator GlxA family with amidase domain
MSAEVETTPYSVAEVAALTGLSARTITKLFENERGVIVYAAPNASRKRASYRTIKIPRHVYERVLRRLSVQ